MQRTIFLTLALAVLLAPDVRAQKLQLSELFTEHTVLQRNVDHPIWGWAKPGRKVKVTLNGKDETVKTGKDGRWRAFLKTGEAGGPHLLTVKAGRELLTLSDVYFGDVYLLSGQSNMEWRLGQSDPDGSRAEAIADPLIRQIKVDRQWADTPREHLPVAEAWTPGTAAEITDFSGVGSYFAHYLRQEIDVPIGLVHSSWGGSRIEPWLSPAALGKEPGPLMKDRDEMMAAATAPAKKFWQNAFGEDTPPTEDQGVAMGYLNDELDESNWREVAVPGMWESNGYKNVDGVFYYRRTFELTAAQAAGAATLHLGTIDDGDLTHINGQPVGETPDAYSMVRAYPVQSGVLRAGKNTIAVRIYDGGGGGGFYGDPQALRLETATGDVPLSGTWKYRVGEWRADASPNQIATILYNAMIAPLEGLPLTGALWYQGESNAGPNDNLAYGDLMRRLVGFYREHFAVDNLPFYWVQLANFQAAPLTPNEPGWAVLRNQQTLATDVKNTGQAVIIDIGEADDIHPRNKWEVGRRLSLHALKDVYGKDVQASSPVATGAREKDGRVIVEFAEIGGGLTVKAGEGDRYGFLRGFTLQDAAGDWHWAQAYLTDEDEVCIVNPRGTRVKVVRYAWANNPDDANLYSVEGLPATPFEIVVD